MQRTTFFELAVYVYFDLQSRSDLEFLWAMLQRFGLQLPSLSSVLSFKVDGVEDCVPLRKVILKQFFIVKQTTSLKCSSSGEASPTIWSCYANLRSSSLFISLEIDCFLGI